MKMDVFLLIYWKNAEKSIYNQKKEGECARPERAHFSVRYVKKQTAKIFAIIETNYRKSIKQSRKGMCLLLCNRENGVKANKKWDNRIDFLCKV